jgi:hypothetical protein
MILSCVHYISKLHRNSTSEIICLQVIKSKEWWEKVLPSCDDKIFRNELRVTRTNFDFILGLIRNNKVFSVKQLDVECQLAIALSRFGEYGSGSAWLKKASRFGVGEGTIQAVTTRVIQVSVISVILPHISKYQSLIDFNIN